MDVVAVPLTVEERTTLPVPASTALEDTVPDRLTVALKVVLIVRERL